MHVAALERNTFKGEGCLECVIKCKKRMKHLIKKVKFTKCETYFLQH